jgi:hypothetical protein
MYGSTFARLAFACVLAGGTLAACSVGGGSAGTSPHATASPASTPTVTPALVMTNCQVGPSNTIDFLATSGQYAGEYVPAPGYGTFTVGALSGFYQSLGVTVGETGQIQSLTGATGTVSLPTAFLTFNGTGSQYELFATTIPAGTVGPFTYVQNGNVATITFQVEGNVLNVSSDDLVGAFNLLFTFNYNGQFSALLNQLPYTAPCTATDIGNQADSHLRV